MSTSRTRIGALVADLMNTQRGPANLGNGGASGGPGHANPGCPVFIASRGRAPPSLHRPPYRVTAVGTAALTGHEPFEASLWRILDCLACRLHERSYATGRHASKPDTTDPNVADPGQRASSQSNSSPDSKPTSAGDPQAEDAFPQMRYDRP